MGANFDLDITINLYSSAQPVNRRSFSLPVFATDDVGAGFTELYRIYASNTEAQADSDLNAGPKAAAAAFFSQPLRPSRLMIAKVVLESVGGELTASLDALLADYDGWYGFAVDSRADADLTAACAWALANRQLYLGQSSDADILSATTPNVFDDQNTLANGRAMGVWHETDAAYADLCWLAAFLAKDPDEGPTVAYKRTLVGITPDDLTSTELANVESVNGNAYLTFYGVGATGPGKLFDGAFADTLLTKDWIVARVGEAIAQYLLDAANRGERIPFTDDGIAQIEGVLRGEMDRGVTVGHFRPGSVVTTVPSIADGEVSDADIIARELTISAEAIDASGIAKVTINLGVLAA